MGAEILTQLLPLDLFIQEMAVKTTLCIHTWNPQLGEGIGHRKSRGHLYQALQILKDHALSSQWIDTEGTWRWDKKFTVTRDNVLATSSSIRCYARGTIFKDKIGWGCHIVDDSISYNLWGLLGFKWPWSLKHKYVQSARQQVHSAQQNKDIYVFVNNLSTLQVFDRFEIKMRTLAECLDSLEYLARMNSVVIALEPTYEGDVCKAMARDQAKLGAINGIPSFTPIPKRSQLVS